MYKNFTGFIFFSVFIFYCSGPAWHDKADSLVKSTRQELELINSELNQKELNREKILKLAERFLNRFNRSSAGYVDLLKTVKDTEKLKNYIEKNHKKDFKIINRLSIEIPKKFGKWAKENHNQIDNDLETLKNSLIESFKRWNRKTRDLEEKYSENK